MLRISPHLCFDGRCEEAFLRYQSVLGGRIVTMLSYGASPIAVNTPSELHARILHATLSLETMELTGVDVPPDEYHRPQGFFVMLTVEGADEATRIFEALSESGTIVMQFQPTFWSAGFGVLIDRFHVPWEVTCRDRPENIKDFLNHANVIPE